MGQILIVLTTLNECFFVFFCGILVKIHFFVKKMKLLSKKIL